MTDYLKILPTDFDEIKDLKKLLGAYNDWLIETFQTPNTILELEDIWEFFNTNSHKYPTLSDDEYEEIMEPISHYEMCFDEDDIDEFCLINKEIMYMIDETYENEKYYAKQNIQRYTKQNIQRVLASLPI